jgi:hypothetical protein
MNPFLVVNDCDCNMGSILCNWVLHRWGVPFPLTICEVDSSPEEKERYFRSFKVEKCNELARIIGEKLCTSWKIYDAKCGEIMVEANYAGSYYVFLYVCMHIYVHI